MSKRLVKPVIGWREWVVLPDLTAIRIKAKIDTGARTSAIHAFDIRRFSDGGAPHVAFALHPLQRRRLPEVSCTAPILDEREVRSSSGVAERRIVIATEAMLGGERWPIELTLTDRDQMGFRMLLGRAAIRRRFVVDPGRSYCVSRGAEPERREGAPRP